MWNIFQFLTSGLLAVVNPDASQVEYRSCCFAGVFHVRVNSSYTLNAQQADDLCQSLFSSLATEEQAREAYKKGLNICSYAWIADGRSLVLHNETLQNCLFPLSEAFCYDASVKSDVDCEEAKFSTTSTPSPQTAKELAEATSSPSPSNNVTEKATTEDSSEWDSLKTKNPTVQTDTEVTPEAIEPIPEVQTPTENPEDGKDNTTMLSENTPTDGDKDVMAIEVPVESTTGEAITVTMEGEEGAKAETNTSSNNKTVGTDVAFTSPDNTTTNSDLNLPAPEDSAQETNATDTEDLPTTTAFAGTLGSSEVNPSEGNALARSTISPVEDITTYAGTFTTSDSEDTNEEVGPDGKVESTTVTSPDDVPETAQTAADQDVDLKEDFTNENNISYGLPAPRGRMSPKDIDSSTQATPAARKGSGTPAWVIIFSFVMAVGLLLCVFAAIATKERWYGPLRQRVTMAKSTSEDTEKRAEVSLSVDKQQEMVTLMNKGQAQTNGRKEEFTVIALEEPPEKEYLA